jgi:hypothetical protein
LLTLVEELVDATVDTIEMMLESPSDIRSRSHADYLQRLQREANAMLAELSAAQ